MKHKLKTLFVTLLISASICSCSALQGVEAVSSIVGQDTPQLSVDAQIGDREASLGANLEVDADTIHEVTGGDKTTTTVKEAGTINQTNYPDSFVCFLILALITSITTGVIGWMMPVPKFIRRFQE